MSTTVRSAFNSFLNNTVNIQKNDSDKAKSSRDFLIEQISNLRSKKTIILWCQFQKLTSRT